MAKKQKISIIEWSIVIVVLALIISGFFAIKELKRQYKSNQVVHEVSALFADYNTFISMYGAPPGDYKDAGSLKEGLKSGNGDGLINTASEVQNVAAHLKAAGLLKQVDLIESKNADDSSFYIISSKINGIQMEFSSVGDGSKTIYTDKETIAPIGLGFARDNINVIKIGDITNNKTANDATFRLIDKQMDDGIFDTGLIRQGICTDGIKYKPGDKNSVCMQFLALE